MRKLLCITIVGLVLHGGGASAQSASYQRDARQILEKLVSFRQLGAEGRGVRGDARLTYPRTHKDYQQILKHVGGLRPGETKPVPPWPD